MAIIGRLVERPKPTPCIPAVFNNPSSWSEPIEGSHCIVQRPFEPVRLDWSIRRWGLNFASRPATGLTQNRRAEVLFQ